MRYVHLLFLCLLSQPAAAQMPHQDSAAEIQQDMRKLAVLGNVLYLAAHPDDENTRFIAYAANELLFNTSYLSLTRGDGGQNLVGPEIREELGIIRTQELLAARRTDGGQQFFTRANDFGYSKTAEETLAIWDEDKILSDVVRVIRQVRPDVIVCRFPVDGGGGHGHHTASALLGLKAFALAAQPDSYPEQLKSLQTWQPQRIVVNTGRWWNPDISTEDPGVVSLNVGAYNTLRGTSYTELAARSRTMHKSQGFGSTGSRGEELEFFEHLAGSPAEQDLFDGVSTDWGRLSGSESIAKQVAALNAQFQSGAPEESIPALLALRKSLQDLSDPFWRTQKIAEVNSLIQACAGLYLEATADVHWAAPGQKVNIDLELVARNVEGVRWVGFDVPALSLSESKNQQLALNIKAEHRFPIRIPANMAPTDPYWLIQKGTLGTYRVDDPSLIGTPETSPPIELELILEIAGEPLNYRIPLVFKWNDPVQGERYRPFSICPAAFVNFSESSHVFTGDQAKEIELKIKAIVPNFSGAVQLLDAPGWEFTPKSWPVSFERQGEEQSFRVTVQPLADAQPLDLSVQLQSDGRTLDRSLNTIAYDHIPTQ
ncbi:MAG: LmbE family N-acetylglucosaminyl deacetylase, partial [Planctomycetota bacterium]